MIRLRVAPVIGAFLVVVLGWGAGLEPFSLHGQRIPVTVEITADQVLYSRDRQMAQARGTVQVTIRRRDRPDQWLKITSGEADANLATGVTDARVGVRIETPRGIFTARQIHVDPTHETFWLKYTAASVDLLRGPDDLVARGYFRGQEMGQKGDTYYVLRGRVTTCDKEHPDWSIEADEIDYDDRTGDMVIRHGRVRLYGISVPMISPYRITVAPRKQKQSILPGIGWNHHDGVFFPYRLRLSGPTAGTSLTTDLKITTTRGMIGRVDAQHFSDINEWSLSLTKAEDELYKHQYYFSLDRTPEVSFTHHVYTPAPRGQIDKHTLDFSVTGGWYREVVEPDNVPHLGPSHSAQRLSFEALEGWRLDRREYLTGPWWNWDAMYNFYDTGDQYMLLSLAAGTSWRVNDNLGLGFGLRHHIKSGDTPLLMDVPDLNTEALPRLDWQINDKWRFNYDGRYDVGNHNWFDYTVALHRQEHCLTYYVSYEKRRHAVSVGVDLSGLMGSPTKTRPYKSQAEPAWMDTYGAGVGEDGAGSDTTPLPGPQPETPAATSGDAGQN